MRTQTQFGAVRKHAVFNDSGETIPAWSLMEPTDFDGLVHTVQKPTVDDSAWVMLNGMTPIEDGGYGTGTWDLPNLAKYETGDGTPAWGESWGSRAGYWGLSRGYEGFLMMGPGADGRVMVERDTLCAEGAAGGPYYDYFYSPYPPHNRTTGCSICTEAPWQWSASITGSTNAGTCGGFPPALPVCSRLNQDIVLTFDFTGAIVTLLRNFVDPNIMCAWSSAQYTPVCFAGNPGVGNSVFYFYNIDGGGGSVTWALRYANGGGFTMNTLWSVDETPISCLTAKSLPLVSNQLPCSSFTDPVVVSPV